MSTDIDLKELQNLIDQDSEVKTLVETANEETAGWRVWPDDAWNIFYFCKFLNASTAATLLFYYKSVLFFVICIARFLNKYQGKFDDDISHFLNIPTTEKFVIMYPDYSSVPMSSTNKAKFVLEVPNSGIMLNISTNIKVLERNYSQTGTLTFTFMGTPQSGNEQKPIYLDTYVRLGVTASHLHVEKLFQLKTLTIHNVLVFIDRSKLGGR